MRARRIAKRFAKIEREVAEADHNVGPLPPEHRSGFVWLDLRLADGHGLGRLDFAVLRYVASVDWYVRRVEPGRDGCWTTFQKMGRVESILRAYRWELAEKARKTNRAEQKANVVPARRLRSVFRKLAPDYVVTANEPRTANGRWVSVSCRRFVAADLSNVDPSKPVVVPLPPKVRPGRGGKRWTPTAAGWTHGAKGRWIAPNAPSKVSPETVKSVHGETPKNEGREAPATVKGVASTSPSLLGRALLDSPTENLVRCAHDRFSSERGEGKRTDKIACDECFGLTCECEGTDKREDRNRIEHDNPPADTSNRPRTSASTAESTPTYEPQDSPSDDHDEQADEGGERPPRPRRSDGPEATPPTSSASTRAICTHPSSAPIDADELHDPPGRIGASFMRRLAAGGSKR